MCRFVAYLGKNPVVLGQVIAQPENSLINQSRQAREGALSLNADGFGISWYQHSIDHTPGSFKSVQPAWNDENLRHITKKIQSTCFLAHVRASTVGGVNTFNCHPFIQQRYAFVHNGTIDGFQQIRRQLLDSLSDDRFAAIDGQTDSEHFFALLMDLLIKQQQTFTLDTLCTIFQEALAQVQAWQKPLSTDPIIRLNTVLTDGKQLFVTRYISDESQEPLSLYYTCSHALGNQQSPTAVLVASEPITDNEELWQEVPLNHLLWVNDQLEVTIKPIKESVR